MSSGLTSRQMNEDCRINIIDVRPHRGKRLKYKRPTNQTNREPESSTNTSWLGPRPRVDNRRSGPNSNSSQKVTHVVPISTIKGRDTLVQNTVSFLETNFLNQVQRHFDTVLVESADMSYRRNQSGRPTKCMSQKNNVQKTIDQMLLQLEVMKAMQTDRNDFDEEMKRLGKQFMELHATATAGCMTLHAQYKKDKEPRNRTLLRSSSERDVRPREFKRSSSARQIRQTHKAEIGSVNYFHAAHKTENQRNFRLQHGDMNAPTTDFGLATPAHNSPLKDRLMYGNGEVTVSNFVGSAYDDRNSGFGDNGTSLMDIDMELDEEMDVDIRKLSDEIGMQLADQMSEDEISDDFLGDDMFSKLSSIV